jgi:hypothetical protein
MQLIGINKLRLYFNPLRHDRAKTRKIVMKLLLTYAEAKASSLVLSEGFG